MKSDGVSQMTDPTRKHMRRTLLGWNVVVFIFLLFVYFSPFTLSLFSSGGNCINFLGSVVN